MVLNRRYFFIGLLVAFILCAMGASAENSVPAEEYVRFHVIAADDSEEAQAFKLSLRDAVAERVFGLFAGCEDGEKAWKTACDNIGLIERWACDAACELGFEGDVRAEAGMFEFEAREYGGMTVPAGEYRTVRIVIGEGKGQNWWCLLYPELCMPEGYEPGMKIEFYSSILRWIHSIFGGNENG